MGGRRAGGGDRRGQMGRVGGGVGRGSGGGWVGVGSRGGRGGIAMGLYIGMGSGPGVGRTGQIWQIWDPDPDRSNQDLIDDRMIDSEI